MSRAAKILEAILADPARRAAFCKAYVAQFPSLAALLTDTGTAPAAEARTDHLRLWQLIADSGVVFAPRPASDLFPQPAQWTGTTTELLALLQSPESKLTAEQRSELRPSARLGAQLMALNKAFGAGVVAYRRTGAARRWQLRKG